MEGGKAWEEASLEIGAGVLYVVKWVFRNGVAWHEVCEAGRRVTLAEAKEKIKAAVKKALETSSSFAVGIQAARASLRHTISNEEAIYSAISTRFRSVEMPAILDQKDTIIMGLHLDVPFFQRINLGWKCWYLHRIRSLIDLATLPEADASECKEKFSSLVRKCEDGAVTAFVNWIAGPGFSRADLFAQIQECFYCLLPPLWCIVYDYIAAPSPRSIRQTILSLVQ